jgi:hypothetical protein
MKAITPWHRAAVKSVRVLVCIVLLAGLHQLVGCGTVGASLGMQPDGSYRLETSEEQASCDVLYKSIWGHIQVIKGLPAKAMTEQATPAPTAFSLFGRWFDGSSKGLKAVEEYDRERAHTFALQRMMREKKCVNVDLDMELAEANSEMARIRRN